MKYLRHSLIVLILGITIFFNIERLDFGRDNLVNIDSFVYILGVLAIVSILSIPLLWRTNVLYSIGFWIGTYLIAKQVFLARPIIGGIYTYLSITEIALLLIVIWLSHHLARSIDDFEDAVEDITLLKDNEQVQSLEKATKSIQAEMFRSRHNHHPLGVLVIQPKSDSFQVALQRAIQEVQQHMLDRYVINTIVHELTHYLRRTDLVIEEVGRHRFIILCPDTNEGDLKILAEYVQTITDEKFGLSVACGAATFPDEALTFDELVHQAETRLESLKPDPISQRPKFSLNGKSSNNYHAS